MDVLYYSFFNLLLRFVFMFLFCFPFDVFILALRSRAHNVEDAQSFVLIFVQFYQNLSFYLFENPI